MNGRLGAIDFELNDHLIPCLSQSMSFILYFNGANVEALKLDIHRYKVS